MKMTKTTLLTFAFSLLLAFSVQAKKKTLLRLNLTKGSVYEMTTEMTNKMDQEMMGQQIKMNQQMQVTATWTVEDILPNDNFLIHFQYKSLKMDMDAMGNKMSFDTDKPDEGDAALNMLSELTKVNLKMEITPMGKVEKIEGLDSFSDSFAKNPQLKEMMKMFTDEETFKSNLGQTFNYFPEDKVAVGDSWEANQTLKSLFNMDIAMNFEVKDIQKNLVTLGINSNINSNSPIEQSGIKMNIEMTGDQKGEMLVNAEDGMLKSSNIDQFFDMKMKMTNPQTNEEMEIPMKMNSIVKVTVSKI